MGQTGHGDDGGDGCHDYVNGHCGLAGSVQNESAVWNGLVQQHGHDARNVARGGQSKEADVSKEQPGGSRCGVYVAYK